jgi:desulfoferrodoxin-like iron-binding protein
MEVYKCEVYGNFVEVVYDGDGELVCWARLFSRRFSNPTPRSATAAASRKKSYLPVGCGNGNEQTEHDKFRGYHPGGGWRMRAFRSRGVFRRGLESGPHTAGCQHYRSGCAIAVVRQSIFIAQHFSGQNHASNFRLFRENLHRLQHHAAGRGRRVVRLGSSAHFQRTMGRCQECRGAFFPRLDGCGCRG